MCICTSAVPPEFSRTARCGQRGCTLRQHGSRQPEIPGARRHPVRPVTADNPSDGFTGQNRDLAELPVRSSGRDFRTAAGTLTASVSSLSRCRGAYYSSVIAFGDILLLYQTSPCFVKRFADFRHSAQRSGGGFRQIPFRNCVAKINRNITPQSAPLTAPLSGKPRTKNSQPLRSAFTFLP